MMNTLRTNGEQRLAKWRVEQERFAQSNLNVEQWCSNEGISKSAFYQRRSRLKLNSAKLEMATIATSPKRSKAFVVQPTFIDAGTLETKPPLIKPAAALPMSDNSGTEVRIDLGGGILITVNRSSASSLADAA